MRCIALLSRWRSNTYRGAKRQWDAYSEHISHEAQEQIRDMQAHYQVRSDQALEREEKVMRELEHSRNELRLQLRCFLMPLQRCPISATF